MERVPITLPTFCYPKKDVEQPCPCQERPVELTHKSCVIFWQAEEGVQLRQDDVVAEVEVEKKTVELLAPLTGRLVQRCVEDGETVVFDQLLGFMEGV